MQNKLHTVWLGDLESYMDELFIKRAFESLGETVLSVKLYRNKGQVSTSSAFAYGFVEFSTAASAREVLMRHNNKPVPGSMPVKLFKLKSTTNSVVNNGGSEAGSYSLHVSCLSHVVDDYTLYSSFKKYPSCVFAKVIYDHGTGVSRRFGFVNFSCQTEMNRAYREMQGFMLCGAPIYLNLNLNAKKTGGAYSGSQQSESNSSYNPPPSGSSSDPYGSGSSNQSYYNYYQQPYSSQTYGYDPAAYAQMGYGSQYDTNTQYPPPYQHHSGNNMDQNSVMNTALPPNINTCVPPPDAPPPVPIAVMPECEQLFLPEFIDGINSAEYLEDERGNAFDYLEGSRWTFMDDHLKSAVQCSL